MAPKWSTRRASVTVGSAVLLVFLILAFLLRSELASPVSYVPSSTAEREQQVDHEKILNTDPKPPQDADPEPPHPRYKPVTNTTIPSITENFPFAARAKSPRDLPLIPHWNRPKHQAVVSYITTGWPPEDIFVVDNTGVMDSNARGMLTLQNPSYLDQHRLVDVFGVNILTAPTLLTFAQLQNFYLYTATQRGWAQYFWSHMDVIALSNEDYEPFGSLYHRAVDTLRESTDPAYGKWAIRFFAYDRLALVNAAAFADVGGWDTMIPYYGTDCDMHERLMMAGYRVEDAGAGFVFDIGSSLPDLAVLYRQPIASLSEDNDADPNPSCPPITPSNPCTPADCHYHLLFHAAEDLQNFKNTHPDGRNFWQSQQHGGDGEPFHRNPDGFELALHMTVESGQRIMAEKWGHRGCNLRGSGLVADDAWRVERDWEG